MKARAPLAAGIAALLAWIAGLLFVTRAALLGWLVGVLALSSVALGCLALLMMTLLVPGSWRRLYGEPLAIGLTLLPVAAVASIPMLAGLWALYPWADPAISSGFAPFKAAWLSPAFFIFRQLAFWAILIGTAAALLLRPVARTAIAAGGLIAYALAASWMGVDLAESLTPEFHSSIYGLLVLGQQWLAGIAFGLAFGLSRARGPAPRAAAGALLVALLMWAYLHAMQFIVIWSGDLPEEVGWYLARGTGAWAWVSALLFLGQGVGPFFAMLLPAVRSSRRAMLGIAILTLCMRPVEAAWLILPGQPDVLLALLFSAFAVAALMGVAAAFATFIRMRRGDWLPARFYAAETSDPSEA